MTVTFTGRGALAGARRCLPLAVTSAANGVLFGVLAGQAGIGAGGALLMSALVFSGAAQFIAVGIWASPVPVFALALAALVVGLRHVLMGMAISPWLAKLSKTKAYISVFFMVDENWALTMDEFRKGGRDAAFLIGGGATMFVSWVGFTVVGYLAGSFVDDPAAWGLDFAFIAVFIALLVGMWRGRSSLFPWAVAAVVATVSYQYVPGQWYILFGGLAGSFAGMLSKGSE